MKLSEILFEEMQRVPPEGYVVVVSKGESGRGISIKFRTINRVNQSARFPEGRWKYAGEIHIQKGITADNNELVWEVESVNADKGYGPLLYDIAMEMVFLKGDAGLMADRRSVSSDARKVWKTYFEQRGDVGHKPLPADMFEEPPFNQRPEYLRYYYFKSSTSMIDSLKELNKIESEDFEL
jgi:hypothetical protein